MTIAATSAAVARLTSVDPATIVKVYDCGGETLWRATNADGHVILAILPTLKDTAPRRIKRDYQNRVQATLTGRCPVCDAVSGATGTGASMRHDPTCRVGNLATKGERWLLR